MTELELIHCFNPDQSSAAFDNLLDFRKFGHFHPSMVKVELVAQKDNRVCEYEVHERIVVMGFIPLRPVYRVEVSEIEQGRNIRYWSQVKKRVSLTIDFSFNHEKDSCTVTEKITVKSNRVIGRIFMGILKKMHLRTIEAMKNAPVVENDPS